jgi:hypothetical protein
MKMAVNAVLIAKQTSANALLLGMAFATDLRLSIIPPSKRRTISARVEIIGNISTMIESAAVSTNPKIGPSKNPNRISISTSEIRVFSETRDERYPTKTVKPIMKKSSLFMRKTLTEKL